MKYSVFVETMPVDSADEASRIINDIDREIADEKLRIVLDAASGSIPILSIDRRLDKLMRMTKDRERTFLVWRSMADAESKVLTPRPVEQRPPKVRIWQD